MKHRNAMPMMPVPSANLIGEDGWREPSLVHSAANAPAKTMMNTGLIDCTQVGGNSQPKRLRSRRASA